MTSEPTQAEVLQAIDAWARAVKIRIGDGPDHARLWEVTMTQPGRVGVVCRDGHGGLVSVAGRPKDSGPQLDPDTALVWALAVTAIRPGAVHASRPCRNCGGTGHDTSEAARLVLDVAPTEALCRRLSVDPAVEPLRGMHHSIPSAWFVNGIGGALSRPVHQVQRDDVLWWVRAGDPIAHEHLAVAADRWQAEGLVLGIAVAGWLRDQELFAAGEPPIGGWQRAALDVLKAATGEPRVHDAVAVGRDANGTLIVRPANLDSWVDAVPGQLVPVRLVE